MQRMAGTVTCAADRRPLLNPFRRRVRRIARSQPAPLLRSRIRKSYPLLRPLFLCGYQTQNPLLH